MNYQAFNNNSLTMMYEAVRGALAGENALYCEPCSEGRHYSRRQRAHILGLTYVRPDPEAPRAVTRKAK